ncbi:hypothetical protein [Beijerinckia sp. L45]|uniref:hypothetical protein n=1 Tax=Beijerinckia sp. L45 TaxID=1641855 RepID=UPI00131EAF70|nr:hypothetical protein [Beijerinckia sp. L45]
MAQTYSIARPLPAGLAPPTLTARLFGTIEVVFPSVFTVTFGVFRRRCSFRI